MEQPNTTVITFNLSSSGLLPYPHWNYKTVIPVVVLSLCCILGVPGNIGVIFLKPNWHHLSSLSQILMLNLAISDMLCLLTLPLWIYSLLYGWIFGLVACKLLAYLVYCGIWGSQLTMTALSIQRYLTVVRQRRFSQMQKRVPLVLLWMAAAILSTPVLVVRHLSTDQHWIVCGSQYFSEAQRVIVLLAETLFDFFSFCLIALLYIRLLRKVNHAAFFKNPQTTRLVTSIIISFLVLWTPFHIINVLGVAATCLKNKSLFTFCIDTWVIVKALTFVSSCLNPFLYAFTSKNMFTVCQQKKQLQMLELQNTQTPDINTDKKKKGLSTAFKHHDISALFKGHFLLKTEQFCCMSTIHLHDNSMFFLTPR